MAPPGLSSPSLLAGPVRLARDHYGDFNPASVKIHPFKRLAARISRRVPRAWRFRLFGLPPRALPAPPGALSALGNLSSLRPGIAAHLGAHLRADGAYLPEFTPGAGPFIESRFLQKQRCLPRVRFFPGSVISLASDGASNYYRWLLETLPRLRQIRQSGAVYQGIYASQKRPFQRETLRLLGCDPACILPSETNPFLRAREILVPRFVDEAEPWIVPWLRDQFLPLVPPADLASSPRRLYITRRCASGRRLLNEAELLAQLAPRGFTAIALEDRPWLEQVALFRQAEIIIGPHGAGLANLVFCSPGALVLELIAETYPFTFFPEICRQVDAAHHPLLCAPALPHEIRRSDLLVPIPQLLRLLPS
jgi:hypothetical protein